jgi:RHS repeat-associated protein
MWVCKDGGAHCVPHWGATPDRTTTTDYWPSGQVKKRTKPNGVEEKRYFLNDRRLKQMVRTKGTDVRKDQTYTYDDNGNRTQDERGTHRFNVRNQLVEWTRSKAAGPGKPAGSRVEYGLTGSGAIKSRDSFSDSTPGSLTRTEDYFYNGDRLTRVEADTPSTSPTSVRYCYDTTGFGEVRRIEDGASCPANLDAPISGQDTIFKYDDLSRMTNARGVGQEADIVYTYDGLDRKDRRIETVGGQPKTFENFYIGLGESLSAEQDQGATKLKSYDYDSQLQRLGQQTKTSTTTTYRNYGHDANGSVEGLEDADGRIEDCTGSSPPPGCKSDSYRYEPYGSVEGSENDLSDAAKDNPFRFQGFHYDSSVGVYDMHARPYEPQTGRFLTADHFQSASADLSLLSDPLTNNEYAFVGGNPVDNIEFDGHKECLSTCRPGEVQRGPGGKPSTIPGTQDPEAVHFSGAHTQPDLDEIQENLHMETSGAGVPDPKPPPTRVRCSVPDSGPAAGSSMACGPPRTGTAFPIAHDRCVQPGDHGCVAWDRSASHTTPEGYLALISAPLFGFGSAGAAGGAAAGGAVATGLRAICGAICRRVSDVARRFPHEELGALGPGARADALQNASEGLRALYAGGSVRGKSIIEIRSTLVKHGFKRQQPAEKGPGYLFQGPKGEQVRIMRRNQGWELRVQLRGRNYLDDVGQDPHSRGPTHIPVGSY